MSRPPDGILQPRTIREWHRSARRAQLVAIAALGAASTLVTAAFAARPSDPLISHTFEDNVGGWTEFGGGKVSITHEAADVHGGKGALRFDYTLEKGGMNVLALPTGDGALAKAKAIHFWAKSNSGAPLAVALQEKDGGRYIATFSVPAGKWQQVDLAPGDFTISDGPDDPKDPNNRLDLDQVENVGIIDLGVIFAQADEAMRKLFGITLGPRTFFIDDFSVVTDAIPPPPAPAAGEYVIDSFQRPQITWVATGAVSMSSAEGKPLAARGLKAAYKQSAESVAGLFRGVPKGALAGMTSVSLEVASATPVKLVLQLEEAGGGKYNAMLDVPGGSELKRLTVAVSEFNPSDDSKDTNGKLDMDQVKNVVIIDANGLLGISSEQNTLWIGNLRAGK